MIVGGVGGLHPKTPKSTPFNVICRKFKVLNLLIFTKVLKLLKLNKHHIAFSLKCIDIEGKLKAFLVESEQCKSELVFKLRLRL